MQRATCSQLLQFSSSFKRDAKVQMRLCALDEGLQDVQRCAVNLSQIDVNAKVQQCLPSLLCAGCIGNSAVEKTGRLFYWESQGTSKSQHELKKDSGVPERYNTLLDGCLKAGMADEGEASRDLLMLPREYSNRLSVL